MEVVLDWSGPIRSLMTSCKRLAKTQAKIFNSVLSRPVIKIPTAWLSALHYHHHLPILEVYSVQDVLEASLIKTQPEHIIFMGYPGSGMKLNHFFYSAKCTQVGDYLLSWKISRDITYCYMNSFGTHVFQLEPEELCGPIYQPHRSGRIWHKVNF